MSAFISIDHLPGRTICHDGQSYLFFSGTSYLGLPQHPDYQRALADNLARYGAVFGSSRNGNLRLRVYDEAEAALAHHVGAEGALTLSSGMLAGQVVMNWLRSGPTTTFLYGPHAHPAVWHEPTVAPPSLSFADWATLLPDLLSNVVTPNVVVVVNSLDAVRSERYAFDWVNELPTHRHVTLVVDDSHGLGVIGPDGRGIWPELPSLPQGRVIVTASLAKAMGLPGGAILSDATTLAALRQTPFFGACSPMPPAYLATYRQLPELYARQQGELARNVALAEARLGPTGLFRQASGYPVFYTAHNNLYAHLLAQGLLIYQFAYPTPADRPNTRIVLSAFHQPADIAQLAEAVAHYVPMGSIKAAEASSASRK